MEVKWGRKAEEDCHILKPNSDKVGGGGKGKKWFFLQRSLPEPENYLGHPFKENLPKTLNIDIKNKNNAVLAEEGRHENQIQH